MTPRVFTLLIFLALSIVVGAQEIREDLQVTLVSLYVTATDSHRKFITDLKPADFVLRENGEVQTINGFSTGSDDLSLNVAFLIDNSASMTAADLEMARTAGLLLLQETKLTDKIFLVTFRHITNSLVEPTFDKTKIEDTLRTIRPQYGTTALYDAIFIAADKLNPELGRKVLILFSDGQDNSSSRKLNDLLASVAALPEITIISIGTHFPPQYAKRYGALEEYKKGKAALEQLADLTGGFSAFPKDKSDLEKSVLDVRNWMQNQYTLSYYPSDRRLDGSWREIRLETRRKDVRVSYRKGYFAPDSSGVIRADPSISLENNGSVQER